jgi:hypothetical protein
MTRKLGTFAALLGALFAACASPPPKAPVNEVDEVVDSNLAARGGQEKLEALTAIRQSGTATASGGRIAKVVREIQRPGRFRLEFTYQGTKSVFANDGEKGWQVAPLQGQFEPKEMAAEADAAAGVDQRDIEGPLVNWREKGHTVELAGRETLPTGEAFKLKVTLKGGAVRYDWVDVQSRQVVRSEVTRIVRGHPTVLESTFSDFRDVGGIVFPHKLEMKVKGRPQVMRIVVDKIELNPALDEARFRLPA